MKRQLALAFLLAFVALGLIGCCPNSGCGSCFCDTPAKHANPHQGSLRR